MGESWPCPWAVGVSVCLHQVPLRKPSLNGLGSAGEADTAAPKGEGLEVSEPTDGLRWQENAYLCDGERKIWSVGNARVLKRLTRL